MHRIAVTCSSLADTESLAKLLASKLSINSIGLSGQLGAGKTAFVRALAKELGVNESITSPTYVFEHEYSLSGEHGFKALHHWDLYRAGEEDFIQELDEQIRDKNRLILIEWPEKVPQVGDLLSLKILIDSPASEDLLSRKNQCFSDSGERIFTLSFPENQELAQALRAFVSVHGRY